jgi:hypothetical protein
MTSNFMALGEQREKVTVKNNGGSSIIVCLVRILTGNHREDGAAPLFTSLMNIRMAYSSILNVDHDIMFMARSTCDLKGLKRGTGCPSGVATAFRENLDIIINARLVPPRIKSKD